MKRFISEQELERLAIRKYHSVRALIFSLQLLREQVSQADKEYDTHIADDVDKILRSLSGAQTMIQKRNIDIVLDEAMLRTADRIIRQAQEDTLRVHDLVRLEESYNMPTYQR